MTVNGIVLNRDGIPNVLQQPVTEKSLELSIPE